jgi:hypothetical protein
MDDSRLDQDQIATVKLNYSPIEVSELVGMPLSEVRHDIKTGQLEATHGTDGSLYISRKELQRWWRVERNGGQLFDREIPRG